MPYVDRPLPADFEVPVIHQKPHDRRLENLRHDGRIRGVQNKIGRDLKNGIIDAAIAHGADGEGEGGLGGYLFLLAAEHKKTFGGLLMKLLPMNLTGGSVEQSLVGKVTIVGVPSGVFLTKDQMAAATAGEPFVIDHKPQLQQPAAIEAPDVRRDR